VATKRALPHRGQRQTPRHNVGRLADRPADGHGKIHKDLEPCTLQLKALAVRQPRSADRHACLILFSHCQPRRRSPPRELGQSVKSGTPENLRFLVQQSRSPAINGSDRFGQLGVFLGYPRGRPKDNRGDAVFVSQRCCKLAICCCLFMKLQSSRRLL